jgi:LacI family transcriptional regulator
MSNRLPTAGTTPTISDVARHAEVSKATVSRVLNGKATVDAEIAGRVLAAVDALGYQPSMLARNLSLGRTNTVGVVVPDLENPMFQEILRGVTRAAAADGYRVLVTDTEEDPTDEAAAAREARRRCDAIVLCSPRLAEPELRALLAELHPVVLVNRELADSPVPSVSIDYASGMEQVLAELSALGHRRVVYLAGPAASQGDRLRRVGIARAISAHRELTVDVVAAGSALVDGAAAVDAVLALDATAVVAFNDLVALGLVSALRQAGVSVPAALSVVGFDDIPFAAFAVPALSTVSVPRRELGAEAWTRLRDTIGGAAGGHPLVFRPRFVARESTAGPRGVGEVAWAAAEEPNALVARLGARELLVLHDGGGLARADAPRPFAHPVTSLAGIVVTESAPDDHPHHFGLSMAVADVDGVSYWGGRTYVAGQGSTLLDNHGVQRVVEVEAGTQPDPGTLRQAVDWIGRDGTTQLRESRVTVVEEIALPTPTAADDDDADRADDTAPRSALRVLVSSTLSAATGVVTIGSPATNGREGAAYGGWFWRLPAGARRSVLSADGPGEATAHGSRAAWVAFVLDAAPDDAAPDADTSGGAVTVLFRQPGEQPFPWFLRTAEYPGVGVSLAATTRTTITAETPLVTGLEAVVVDAALDAAQAAAIHRALLTAEDRATTQRPTTGSDT